MINIIAVATLAGAITHNEKINTNQIIKGITAQRIDLIQFFIIKPPPLDNVQFSKDLFCTH